MDTIELVSRLRRVGTDLTDVEVKAAARGLPKSTVETVSAFANGSGGVLLLGLSETEGFAPASGFDALTVRDALARACDEDLDPPVRDPIVIDEVDSAPVIRMDVSEADVLAKPCFVRARGAYQGSFIRGGDGDRRLTHYEVTQLLSNHGQPHDDAQPVAAASVDDLDGELVTALLRRVRQRAPRAFDSVDDVGALVRLGAVALVDGAAHPTLAGLLCLGTYPQQFFPQLFVSFVSLPGRSMGDELSDGTRFLDNQTCDGPIPLMVEEAVEAVRRNMRTAAVMAGVGRRDRYDYPLEAVRELVVNAVMHRDYGPLARGTQVQVELYPDRLALRNPGGLFGGVVADQLGVEHVSSSRNAVLAKLLADVPLGRSGEVVSENRGSGLPRVMTRLREAGMSPPRFDATPAHVHVTVPQHALLDPDTVSWIGTLGAGGLTGSQHLALGMMRSNGSVSNEMLRAWGVESHEATAALTDLVARALARKSGGRRYASYRLADGPHEPTIFGALEEPEAALPAAGLDPSVAAVLEAIRAGATTSRAIQGQLNLSYSSVIRRIRAARDAGLIEETQTKHSRAQSYRLLEP